MEFVLALVIVALWWSLGRAHASARRARADAEHWRRLAARSGGVADFERAGPSA